MFSLDLSQLARRPFEREETALDILGCASSTLAAGVALEAAAARGSRGAGVGDDGVHHGSSQATTEDGQNGESQARSVSHWSHILYYDRVGAAHADPSGLYFPAHLSAHGPSLSIPTHLDAFQLRF